MKASELLDRLGKRFAPPEYLLLRNVRNATGYGSGIRYGDAIALGLWPSKGHPVHGFEIKVDRADWRRELLDPAKSESLARFCTNWWIVAPPKIVPKDEVPERWGLLEARGKRLYTVKAAPILPRSDPDWPFLMSLLRRAGEQWIPRRDIEKTVDDAFERGRASSDGRLEAQRDSATHELERVREKIEQFESASGIKFDHWTMGKIGTAVSVIRDGGLDRTLLKVRSFRDESLALAAACDSALEALDDAEKTR